MIYKNDVPVTENSNEYYASYNHLNYPNTIEYDKSNNTKCLYAYQRYLIKKPRTRKKGRFENGFNKKINNRTYYPDKQQNINNIDYYQNINNTIDTPKRDEIIIENNYPYVNSPYYESQEKIVNSVPYTNYYNTVLTNIEQPKILNSQPISSLPPGIINYENYSPQIIQYPESNIINNNISSVPNIQPVVLPSQNYMLNNQLNNNLNINPVNYQSNPAILTSEPKIVTLKKIGNVTGLQNNNLLSYNNCNNVNNISLVNKENFDKNINNDLYGSSNNKFFKIKKITKSNSKKNITNDIYNDINNDINNNINNNNNNDINNNINNKNYINNISNNINALANQIDFIKNNVKNNDPVKVTILKNPITQDKRDENLSQPIVKVKRVYKNLSAQTAKISKIQDYNNRPSYLSCESPCEYKFNDGIAENKRENNLPLFVQKVEKIPINAIRNINIINKNDFGKKTIKKVVYPKNLSPAEKKIEINSRLSEIRESDNELYNTLDDKKNNYEENKNNEVNKFLENEKQNYEDEDRFNQLNNEERFKKKMQLLLEQYDKA